MLLGLIIVMCIYYGVSVTRRLFAAPQRKLLLKILLWIYAGSLFYMFIPLVVLKTSGEKIWFLQTSFLGESQWVLEELTGRYGFSSIVVVIGWAVCYHWVTHPPLPPPPTSTEWGRRLKNKKGAVPAPFLVIVEYIISAYYNVTCFVTYFIIWSGGIAPTNWSTCAPPLNIVTCGILLTP